MRYRTSNEDLPGSPGLANRSRRWAIFVHGCFWHRHSGCSKATAPKRNAAFWSAKFQRNVERDREARGALRRVGFRVLTLWQCEVESPGILARRLGNVCSSFRCGPLKRHESGKVFFPSPGFVFKLDPTFEPKRNGGEPASIPAPNPDNTAKFAILQKYNRVGLVVPVNAPHMWHAAMSGTGCKLTVLGEHYRRLVDRGRI